MEPVTFMLWALCMPALAALAWAIWPSVAMRVGVYLALLVGYVAVATGTRTGARLFMAILRWAGRRAEEVESRG